MTAVLVVATLNEHEGEPPPGLVVVSCFQHPSVLHGLTVSEVHATDQALLHSEFHKVAAVLTRRMQKSRDRRDQLRDRIGDVLANHHLGPRSDCIDAHGMPHCNWAPDPRATTPWSVQHRHHVTNLLLEVVGRGEVADA